MSALTDLAALADKAARIIAAQSPEARAAADTAKRRAEFIAAAQRGTDQQDAEYRAIRETGSPDEIAAAHAVVAARARQAEREWEAGI